MVTFAAHAIQDIGSDANTIWAEAITLQWLRGWDSILVTEPPRVGGEFQMIEEGTPIAGRWTRVEYPTVLAWAGADGSSAELALDEQHNASRPTTTARYNEISAPSAMADKVMGGLYKTFAPGRARRESDKFAAGELCNLDTRIQRRASGDPDR
jgi:hypothetical protein